MRVLVTGASGFIGSHVAARLAVDGAAVRAFCRSEPPAEANAAEWIPGDVTDPSAVARAADGCDAVVHSAALYSYKRCDAPVMQRVNVEGTRNVIEAATRARARLLVTSSAGTCGPVRGRPGTERDHPPAWELCVAYKRSKLAAERLAIAAARAGTEVVCVNPTTVVGPGDRQPTPSGKMILDLVEGRIGGYLRGAGINVVGVQDVARGHALALARGVCGQRYILGGEDLWMRDAFALALTAVERRPPRLGVPWRAVYGAARLTDVAARARGREAGLLNLDEVRLARLPLFFSSDKARAELGYAPRPAAEALAAAARWFAHRA